MAKRCKKIGDFKSKMLGNGDKITYWNAFVEFAQKHGGKTILEMDELCVI